MLSILFSTALCIVFWVCLGVQGETTALGNPQVYGYFMQCAALVLAFTTSISYSRFWEALGHLTQMTNAMSQATSFVLSFDESTDTYDLDRKDDGERETSLRWRAITLHYFSIFHAVCCQTLFSCDGVDARLDIIGGLTEDEKTELSAVNDQASLVAHWINERIAKRVMAGGLPIPPPIASNLWQMLSSAMTNYQCAVKILDTPLPLPYQQCLAWSDIIVMCLTPFIICSFVQNLALAALFTFCTAWLFHGIYLADVIMQQPFGNKDNDLPVVERHRDFIDRLISYINLDLANEINRLYEHVDSNCSMHLPQAGSNHNSIGHVPGHHPLTRPVSFRAIEVIPRRHSEDCGKTARIPSLSGGPMRRSDSISRVTPVIEHPFEETPMPHATDPPMGCTPLDMDDRAASARPLKTRCSAPETVRGIDPCPYKQLVTYRCTIRPHQPQERPIGHSPQLGQKPVSRITSKPSAAAPQVDGAMGLFLGDKILAKEYLMPASKNALGTQQQQPTVHHHHNYHINHHHHHVASSSPRSWILPLDGGAPNNYLPILAGIRDSPLTAHAHQALPRAMEHILPLWRHDSFEEPLLMG